jgi:hypothetical protein
MWVLLTRDTPLFSSLASGICSPLAEVVIKVGHGSRFLVLRFCLRLGVLFRRPTRLDNGSLFHITPRR